MALLLTVEEGPRKNAAALLALRHGDHMHFRWSHAIQSTSQIVNMLLA